MNYDKKKQREKIKVSSFLQKQSKLKDTKKKVGKLKETSGRSKGWRRKQPQRSGRGVKLKDNGKMKR